jgi:hypothetical protein
MDTFICKNRVYNCSLDPEVFYGRINMGDNYEMYLYG